MNTTRKEAKVGVEYLLLNSSRKLPRHHSLSKLRKLLIHVQRKQTVLSWPVGLNRALSACGA